MASAKSASTKFNSPKFNQSSSNDFGKVNFHASKVVEDKMITDILGNYDRETVINSEQLANILNRNEFKQNFYSINFDLEMCKLFMSVINNPNNVDRADSIKIGSVFDIYKLLNRYKDVFSHYDTNNCGLMEPHQLSISISKLGFYLSPSTIKSVVDHYATPVYTASTITPPFNQTINNNSASVEVNNEQSKSTILNNEFIEQSLANMSYDYKFETEKRFKISFQQFVKCCTKLKALSDMFHERDLEQNRKPTGNCAFNYEEFIKLMMNL